MNTIIEKLFPSIMFFGTLLLAFAIFSTLYFYFKRIKPKHVVGAGAYISIILGFVAIGLLFAWYLGIRLACSTSYSRDLCGVWGFLITGPISGSLAIFLAELALYRRR